MDIYGETQDFYMGAAAPKMSIGKTVFGREIYAVRCGEGAPVGVAVYAIHGREFITAKLAFEQYKIGVIGSVWLIPLVNADGALLSQVGLTSAPVYERKKLRAVNGNSEDFSLWKANGRGVDLNVNFDADWGKGVRNVFSVGPENFVGETPFSEPESRALREFTLKIPSFTVEAGMDSWTHPLGEEAFYEIKEKNKFALRDLSRAVSEMKRQ